MKKTTTERILPVYGITSSVASKQFLRVINSGLEFCGTLNSLEVRPMSMPYAMPRIMNEETLEEGFLPIWNRVDFMHFLLALLLVEAEGGEVQLVHHRVKEPYFALGESPPKLEISVWDTGAAANYVAAVVRPVKDSDLHGIPGLRRMWKPASIEFEGQGQRKAKEHFRGVMKLYREDVRRTGGVKAHSSNGAPD